MNARQLAWVGSLAILGCKPEPEVCLTAQAIELDSTVLTTGLVVSGNVVTLLHGDGTLEPVAKLPYQVEPREWFAHDPATAKLWWVDRDVSLPGPWTLHQFDLASETEDWVHGLVFPDYDVDWINSILHHEGALYLGGSLLSEDETDIDGSPVRRSLLARYDADGTERWAHIGQPGFGLQPEDVGVPLERVYSLHGVADGISFLGSIRGTEAIAATLVSADLETGEVLWSTRIAADFYSTRALISGRDDLLIHAVAPIHPPQGSPATLDIAATTPLGEPRWRLDDYMLGRFSAPNLNQVLLNDRVVHIATELDFDASARARVLVQDLDGELLCESDVPELIDNGESAMGVLVTGVRGEFIVVRLTIPHRSFTWLMRP